MIVAILQARVGSSRLPGKVLKPILGVPMLVRQIERVARARRLEKLVIATSTDPADDSIADLGKEHNISVYRGSLADVLDRYYFAAKHYGATTVVRLTGDCPLADHSVIDKVIDEYRARRVDYASNALQPTYPDGLDVEVFSFEALHRAWREAQLPSEREHVTPYINRHSKLFKLLSVTQPEDLSSFRWTVDTFEDFEFVRRIYEALYPTNPTFETADVLRLLRDYPSLVQINTHIERNEGMKKSLKYDDAFLREKGEK